MLYSYCVGGSGIHRCAAPVSALFLDHDFHEEEKLGKIAVILITIFF